VSVLAAALLALVVAILTVIALLHAAEDPVTVVVRFFPTPGREDELLARLTKLRDFVHKTAPGVTYKLYRSLKEPVVFPVRDLPVPGRAGRDGHVGVSGVSARAGADPGGNRGAPGRA
jgi:hypothetical protein